MNETLGSPDNWQVEFDKVPANFPLPAIYSSVAGYQPKLALVKYEGRFYRPGGTPPERFSRWDICEDLAQQLVVKSRESKAGKRMHMPEVDILAQYCERLLKTGWGSDDELKWVIRRTAEILRWPAPASATANNSTTFLREYADAIKNADENSP